jgi:hypothetical protein
VVPITGGVRDVRRVREYVALAGRDLAARHDLALWSPLLIAAVRLQVLGC